MLISDAIKRMNNGTPIYGVKEDTKPEKQKPTLPKSFVRFMEKATREKNGAPRPFKPTKIEPPLGRTDPARFARMMSMHTEKIARANKNFQLGVQITTAVLSIILVTITLI